MNKKEALIQAQYQSECIAYAMEDFKSASVDVLAPILDMVDARAAALVYLTQFARTGVKPDNFTQILKEAAVFDAG